MLDHTWPSSGLVWNESATETLYWKSGEIISIWRRVECEFVLIELKRALKSLQILICFKIRQKRSRIRWPFAPCWPPSTWIISLFYLQKEPIDSPPDSVDLISVHSECFRMASDSATMQTERLNYTKHRTQPLCRWMNICFTFDSLKFHNIHVRGWC